MPKFEYKEIVADIHRAVRYVRHHAADWRVDPQRLGISGASAGGNLSLVIATGMLAPKPDPESDDPVEHESSAIQAVRPAPNPSCQLRRTDEPVASGGVLLPSVELHGHAHRGRSAADDEPQRRSAAHTTHPAPTELWRPSSAHHQESLMSIDPPALTL